MTDFEIYSVNPDVRWRDVFELVIPNDNLRQRVETFLDVLESSAFRYDFMDARTKAIRKHAYSGQELLGKIAAFQHVYLETGFMMALNERGLTRNGKLVIAQHDRPYAGELSEQCGTAFIGVKGKESAFPVRIMLGADYLCGAQYKGVDGQDHPITVDGALVKALTHFAYNTLQEHLPIMIEGLIVGALGGTQRSNKPFISYVSRGNGGFRSLAHTVEKGGPLSERPDITMPDIERIFANTYRFGTPEARPAGPAAPEVK